MLQVVNFNFKFVYVASTKGNKGVSTSDVYDVHVSIAENPAPDKDLSHRMFTILGLLTILYIFLLHLLQDQNSVLSLQRRLLNEV